jgi:hypothetical protein
VHTIPNPKSNKHVQSVLGSNLHTFPAYSIISIELNTINLRSRKVHNPKTFVIIQDKYDDETPSPYEDNEPESQDPLSP